jgi:hypothetical protein
MLACITQIQSPFNFLQNQILICYCRSQIFELCHVFKASVSYLCIITPTLDNKQKILKLSVGLIKCHVLSLATASRILNLDTRWRWLVSFTPRPFYPEERSPDVHCILKCVISWTGLGIVKRDSQPQAGIESGFLDRTTRNLVNILTDISRFWKFIM